MALASLCNRLITAPDRSTPWTSRFHAFVVDHQARLGSANEAHGVKEQLQTWGIR